MELLKKYFPLAFKPKKDIVALIINLLIHIVIDAVLGVVIGIILLIPIIGAIIGLVSGLVGLYFFVSMVLSVLDYMKVLK